MSSCTAALHLALLAAGIGPGDEVVVPSLSFIATANAVRYVGARPVFADVDAATQNLVPETVQPGLTGRTRAVILVDQAGVPADLASMQALCEPRGVAVIEDAACAAGAEYRGSPSAQTPSSPPSHSIRASSSPRGKVGCSSPRTSEVAARLRRLREHGMDVSAAQRHASQQPVIEQLPGDRLQLPDDRRSGRDRPGPAGQAGPPHRPAACTGRAIPASCWPISQASPMIGDP